MASTFTGTLSHTERMVCVAKGYNILLSAANQSKRISTCQDKMIHLIFELMRPEHRRIYVKGD